MESWFAGLSRETRGQQGYRISRVTHSCKASSLKLRTPLLMEKKIHESIRVAPLQFAELEKVQ